jgi:hypothetical protein
MDKVSPARQAKLSLMLIIVFCVGCGSFAAFGFEEWLRGNTNYVLQWGLAGLFLAVALLHARKVSRLIP